MKKIEIVEVNENETVIKKSIETEKPMIEVVNEQVNVEEPPKVDLDSKSPLTKSQGLALKVESEINESQESPKPSEQKNFKKPKTSVQFSSLWRKCSSIEDKVSFLSKLKAQDYANIFKQSMDPNVFSGLLEALSVMDSKISSHILGLSKIPRISALIMFLEKQDDERLQKLIEKAKVENVLSTKELQQVENTLRG